MLNNSFKIMEFSNRFSLRLRSERETLHMWDSLAERLGIPLDVMEFKIIEFGGSIEGWMICFMTRLAVEQFIEEYLEPQLVMAILTEVKIESKSWG